MENDANGMVRDAGTVVPDPPVVPNVVGTPTTIDEGSQAKCPRKEEAVVLLGGCGATVNEEGTQKGFPAEGKPKGVVLPKGGRGPAGGRNPVWSRSSSLTS